MDYMGNPCPKRGTGLSHARNQSGHCAHCGEFLTLRPPSTEANLIQDRLAALAAQYMAHMPMIGPEHMDDDVIEPRAITGGGPQGRADGPGRFHLPKGELTIRDKKRVESYVGFRKWLSEHGGGERA